MSWPSGETYIGTFLNGKYHGHGTLKLPDESKYIGCFFNGVPHGQGQLTSFKDGT